jgi:hypothetical protein
MKPQHIVITALVALAVLIAVNKVPQLQKIVNS